MGKSSGGIRNANKPKSKISKEGKEEARERELQKLNAPYREIYRAKNGSSVSVSPYADRKDLQENITTAKVIADELGVSVKIRPHLILEGYKNPEYEIKGLKADRKDTSSYNGIKKNLEYAKAQGIEAIVYDITKFKEWTPNDIARNLKGKILNYKGADFLKEVFFVNSSKAISFAKQDILDNYSSVVNKIEKLQ